jgi:hypothetical protein
MFVGRWGIGSRGVKEKNKNYFQKPLDGGFFWGIVRRLPDGCLWLIVFGLCPWGA